MTGPNLGNVKFFDIIPACFIFRPPEMWQAHSLIHAFCPFLLTSVTANSVTYIKVGGTGTSNLNSSKNLSEINKLLRIYYGITYLLLSSDTKTIVEMR